MATSGQARKRAVRLTPQAIDLLTHRLIDDWAARGGTVKLTREARAERLGLSVVTTDRILKGLGVDRSSLITAFTSLGLPWDDRYCRSCSEESGPQPTTAVIGARPKRTWPVVASTFGTLAIIVASFVALRPLTVRADDDPVSKWQREYAATMNEAVQDYYDGDYESSRALLRKAKRMAVEFRDVLAIAWSTRVEADLEAERGDLEAALDKYGRARILFESVGALDGVAASIESTAEIELRSGRLKEARSLYLEFKRLAEQRQDSPGVASALRGLGSVEAKSGRRDAAKASFQKGLNVFSDRPDDNIAVDIRARLALVWAEEGDLRRAATVLGQCLRHWQRQGHERWVATTRAQLASVYMRAGDLDRARSEAEVARTGFQNVQDRVGVRECERLLESIGLRANG
ncbi:MAG: tetratricopeptide repeat protein [Armatimonadetes bacterium]|nr:tetratricopeptide repeat protein [Armatimonadota bacterium]